MVPIAPYAENKSDPKVQGKVIVSSQGEAVSALTARKMQEQGNRQDRLKLKRIMSRQVKGKAASYSL